MRWIKPSGFIVAIHLLKIRPVLVVNSSLGFAVSCASYSLLSSSSINSLFAKNSMSSVYIPTIPKALFFIVINRHGLYKDGTISSLSLW